MSSKGLGKPLTKQLIFTKTKTDSLHNIKNLNMWGSQLEDLKILSEMPNLQVVSLSVNKINSLRYFQKCFNLQELYLRKNSIDLIHQIRYLTKLPLLKVLWLCDNPCSQIANYRQIVIKHLPNLVKLDNDIITPEQKIKSQKNTFFIQNTSSEQFYKESKQKEKNTIYKEKDQYQANLQRQRNLSHKEDKNNNKKQKQFKQFKQTPQNYAYQHRQTQKNQNILMAVLSLLQQLDSNSLQIVKRQAQKLMRQK